MVKRYKKRKIVSKTLALLVLLSFLAGFFQIQNKTGGIQQLLGENMSYLSVSSLNINRALNGQAESNTPAGEEKGGQESKNLVFFLSSMSSLNSTVQLMLVVWSLFLGALFTVPVKSKNQLNLNISQLRHYLQWCLNFLTPVAKCILNRADVYDINPITEYRGDVSPRFCIEQNAGFFYGESR